MGPEQSGERTDGGLYIFKNQMFSASKRCTYNNIAKYKHNKQ